MVPYIEINNRRIGVGFPTYIVAEMSANHGQNFERAVKIIEAAKASGADAIKCQTFTPETHTIKSDRDYFRVGGGTLWDGKNLYDLYAEAYMPWDWQPKLQAIAHEVGLDFFSAAVDATGVDFLETLNVPVHKITSFELVDSGLIKKMACTGKPLIMSTGMATLAEIEEAVRTAQLGGTKQIALLRCNSSYPAPPEEMNLKTIPHLSEAFGLPVGLSDHTIGIATSVAAVVMGACIIEKHFTLSRTLVGPDSTFSMEPNEFRMMVDSIRITEKALGQVNYGLTVSETKNRVFRRSLFVTCNVKKGETFTESNVRSIRPGYGLLPRYLERVLGRKAVCDIEKGTPLSWGLIAGGK